MPRLVGKRSNPTPVIVLFMILAAAAVGVSLEYDGYINLFPEFGRTSPDRTNQTDDFGIR